MVGQMIHTNAQDPAGIAAQLCADDQPARMVDSAAILFTVLVVVPVVIFW